MRLQPSIQSLKPATILGASKPHGTRLRYMAGCKCDDCRAANTNYEKERARARKRGEWNGIVSANKAKRHLDKLSRQGVGRRAVADATDISQTTLCKIRKGIRRNIRAETEKLILAVNRKVASDHALIDAAPTKKLIATMMSWGNTKSSLANMLGLVGSLQVYADTITVSKANKIQVLHDQIKRGDKALAFVPPQPSRAKLRKLLNEGASEAQLNRLLGDAWQAAQQGKITGEQSKAIDAVYAQLMVM